MIDLTTLCGFTLKLDETRGRLIFGDDVGFESEYLVPLTEIIPILLNKYLKYPEKVYKHHKNVMPRNTVCGSCYTHDMIHIPYGLLGIEFVKTHIYYTPEVSDKYAAVIQPLMGNVAVIMQKNEGESDEFNITTFVEDVTIVHLEPSQKLAIPSGVYYSIVNIGMTPAIISSVTSVQNTTVDYEVFKREKGLAYFIISKNAKVEAVANPKYRVRNKLRNAPLRRLMKDENFKLRYYPFDDVQEPLFNFISRNDMLSEILLS